MALDGILSALVESPILTTILGSPVVVLITKYVIDTKKKKKRDPFLEEVNEGEIVYEQLDQMLQDYEADRIWIARFHNGGVYYPTGKSIQKFSIFFEVARSSKDSMKLVFQNIPVNLFNRFLKEIVNRDYIAIHDFKDEKVATHGMKYVAEEYGTKSSYIFSLRSVDDRLIGIMSVDFTTRKKNLSEEDLVSLRLEASKIGGVLANRAK